MRERLKEKMNKANMIFLAALKLASTGCATAPEVKPMSQKGYEGSLKWLHTHVEGFATKVDEDQDGNMSYTYTLKDGTKLTAHVPSGNEQSIDVTVSEESDTKKTWHQFYSKVPITQPRATKLREIIDAFDAELTHPNEMAQASDAAKAKHNLAKKGVVIDDTIRCGRTLRKFRARVAQAKKYLAEQGETYFAARGGFADVLVLTEKKDGTYGLHYFPGHAFDLTEARGGKTKEGYGTETTCTKASPPKHVETVSCDRYQGDCRAQYKAGKTEQQKTIERMFDRHR